jgi:prophage regulatory protein
MFKNEDGSDRLLRRREVEELTGLSRSTIYDWIRTGQFPRPVSLGPRTVRWSEREVERWISDRIGDAATEPGIR